MNIEMPRLYGITGPRGAGKDTAGDHLATFGLMHNSLSDQLRAIARERELPVERDVLRGLGREVRTQEGGGILVRRAIAEWESQSSGFAGGLAISGHFSREETLEIRANGGQILFVDAPLAIRWQREEDRKRPDIAPSIEVFMRQEDIEMNGLAGPNTPFVNFARHLPGTVVLMNDGTPDNFHRQLESQLAIMRA